MNLRLWNEVKRWKGWIHSSMSMSWYGKKAKPQRKTKRVQNSTLLCISKFVWDCIWCWLHFRHFQLNMSTKIILIVFLLVRWHASICHITYSNEFHIFQHTHTHTQKRVPHIFVLFLAIYRCVHVIEKERTVTVEKKKQGAKVWIKMKRNEVMRFYLYHCQCYNRCS